MQKFWMAGNNEGMKRFTRGGETERWMDTYKEKRKRWRERGEKKARLRIYIQKQIPQEEEKGAEETASLRKAG